ncbi:MAG: DUF4124 domain-containing protein [Nitrosomonas sp.]|nr:DUF4124 domain-containing protein [Nitrosomonas sp.]MDR4651155.1 DUF4124 domain-containing protein [Nitrosomonas sp.]
MKTQNFLLIAALSVYTNPVLSGVYKHIDEQGNVTYSNVRSTAAAEEVDLPPLVVVPSVDAEGIDDRIRQRRENNIIREQRKDVERRIAEETAQLDMTRAEYKGGKPDRLGSERNYQRYLDRVERLKNEISAREISLQALQRELENIPEIK